jgi:LPPG:FO 2-phospho-L-lactate transferase
MAHRRHWLLQQGMIIGEKIVALAGGVGGAKLALGLARTLPSDGLTVVVNTADDFEHLGLHVSPDIDTVTYTLADLANPETGWGRRDESWNFMAAIEKAGGETWFRLGDKDLATHVIRTKRLRAGDRLSAITRDLARQFGVEHEIVPMSDDPVRTIVATLDGDLEFQDWFVGRRCEPAVRGVRFAGIEKARAHQSLALGPGTRGMVVCPSNPFVSVAPIVGLPGVRDAIERTAIPRVAISPIVGGHAIKGPAAKMLAELGHDVSALGVARHYIGLLDGFVLDAADSALKPAIEALGMRVLVANTLMNDDMDKQRLAMIVLDFVDEIAAGKRHA